MNPLRLRAHGYRTFTDLDLELPDGCTAIVGPNGAGKSSIVNAVELALFGGRLADHLSDSGDVDELMIELTFEHRGETYRVRRSYSARGRGKTVVDLERDAAPSDGYMGHAMPNGHAWEPLTLETAKATQQLIEETLGFTRDTWRASSFLAQGDGAAFCEADPRDRKRILAEAVLGRDPIWPRLLEAVRVHRRAADTRLAEIVGALERADADLARLDDVTKAAAQHEARVTQAAAALAAAEQRLERVAESMRAAETQAAERRTAEARADEARHRLAALQQVETAGKDADDGMLALDGRIVVLEGLVAQGHAIAQRNVDAAAARAQWEQRKTERERLLGESKRLQAAALDRRNAADHLAGSEEGTETCDRCEQTLGAEAAARAVASFRSEAETLDVQASAATQAALAIIAGDEPGPLEQIPSDVRDSPGELGAARERRASLQQRIDAASDPTFHDQLADARQTLTAAEVALGTLSLNVFNEIDALKAESLTEHANVNDARQARDEAMTAHTAARVERDRLQALAEQTKSDREERDTILVTVDQLAILDRAYSQNGIPALLIENAAIPQIEAEANRILQDLGGVATHIELRTQRELKSGDGLREALDVVVYTDAGQRDYSTLSGGERSRVNVALRIALARLLASRRGAESELLVLDEPESLDDEGQARLADVLRGLHGDFRSVILVSHVPGLRDVFDQTIEVVKEDGRSRVIGATVEEPVAA